jgi:mitogen-activated protein kinase 15
VIGRDIVPPLSDDVQLTVEEYRNKLYELIMQKKLERRRRRKEEEESKHQMKQQAAAAARQQAHELKEQMPPPSEPMERSPKATTADYGAIKGSSAKPPAEGGMPRSKYGTCNTCYCLVKGERTCRIISMTAGLEI